jgi:hypothetical protein
MMDRQITFFNETAVPDPPEELVFGDNLSGVLD